MNICRTETCKTITLLRNSEMMIEGISMLDKDMNHARKCRIMADKLEKKLINHLVVPNNFFNQI